MLLPLVPILLFLLLRQTAEAPSVQTVTPSNTIIENSNGSVGIVSPDKGRYGSGCPIASNVVVTAYHVWQGVESGSYLKNGVQLQALKTEPKIDVAYLTWADPSFNGRFQKWFKVQKNYKDGDPIHVPVYDGGIIKGYVLWTIENEIFLDAIVFPGLSGSCILNEKEEVIGIVTELRSMPDNPRVRSIMVGRKVEGR